MNNLVNSGEITCFQYIFVSGNRYIMAMLLQPHTHTHEEGGRERRKGREGGREGGMKGGDERERERERERESTREKNHSLNAVFQCPTYKLLGS